MDKIQKNLEAFIKKHEEIYKAYENYGKSIHEKGGPLDEKTRWLIKIVISATSQHEFALRTHIRKALAAGCTYDEIEHALLLVAPSAGFPKTMQGLNVLEEEKEGKYPSSIK